MSEIVVMNDEMKALVLALADIEDLQRYQGSLVELARALYIRDVRVV